MLSKTILCLVLSLIGMLISPLYGYVIGVFIFGLFCDRDPWKSIMLVSFSVGSVVWGVWSIVLDQANQSMLSSKVATLLGAPGPWSLIMVTAGIGGVIALLAACLGSSVKRGNG